MNCNICKETYPDSYDCGGDCMICLAESGDPECVAHALEQLRYMHKKMDASNEIVIDLMVKNEQLQGDNKILAAAVQRQSSIIQTVSRAHYRL